MNWYELEKRAQNQMTPEAQNAFNQDWAKRHGIQVLPNGNWVLYHGTSPQNAKRIRQQGSFQAGTFFSEDPSYAQHEGGKAQTRQVVVLKVAVDPNLVWAGIHVQAKTVIPLQEVP